MKKFGIAMLCGTLLATAATAQTDARTKAYIDAGFATMDANRDGKVDRSEFDRFMRIRLARQAQQLDSAFAGLDTNQDSGIDPSEAAVLPQLADNFAAVDADNSGKISKGELRAAAAAAQAQEAGFTAR
ncbi:hypothetical protein LK533_16655 [Sphingomonas sp. PL-96]|uniref:hypothetical protein n=1 Tax=Sphingomonas sp. PL-96 TaxID=2887201 RepID=UPI001E6370EB|nr:hypothetical protein [Sphingomonas sp. PL-96]MCC2978282.1 hypothetical protein [Sphingomonas sp. PL-96]